MAAIEPGALCRQMPLRFTGTGREYFNIWIVNLCLTIITIGIYSAWAKVRRLRYFYGNTLVDDYNFSYLADPVQILKGRLIAVGVLILYSLSWDVYPEAGLWFLTALFLLFPFILVSATSFHLRNSAYRNIRFFFLRDYAGAYRIFVLPILLVSVLTALGWSLIESSEFLATAEAQDPEFNGQDMIPSLFLLALMPVIPWLDYLRMRFIINRSRFGTLQAEFSASAWQFYRIYLVALLQVFAIAFAMSLLIIAIAIAGSMLGVETPEEGGQIAVILITIVVLFMYGMLFFVSGYIRARRTNLVYGSTRFEEIRINSALEAMPIGRLYLGNTIAIIVSLGLLIPWAQIRMTKYITERIELESRDLGNVDAFLEGQRNAIGEEMIEAFDLDLGL